MKKPRAKKYVICISCDKEKHHFGFNMCSSCLRNWKRKNKPSFYLGTCYSEITRRVKTFDLARPNYFGLDKCTREEFINTFKEDNTFLKLWNEWRLNGFIRGDAPSVDRIDNKKGYTIDNIQWLSHRENSKKDWSYKMILDYGSKNEIHFESQQSLCEFLKVADSIVIKKLRECNPALIKGRVVFKVYA